MRGLTLEIPNVPANKIASVVFIGFESKDIDGDWAREGIRPMHHTVMDPAKVTATMTLDVSLHGDLTYFAIVDLDADQVPTPGDLTSGPVVVSKDVGEAPASFVVERVWGQPGAVGAGAGGEPPGDPSTPAVETVTRTVRLDTEIRPPFLKEGRVLVVGLPPSGQEAYVGPLQRETTFVWATESIELAWPVEIQAQLPSSGDVLFLLDLDGGLQPSVGDLASDPTMDFEPLPEGETMDVTLVGPLTEDGEGGDSGDEVERLGEVPKEGEQLGEPSEPPPAPDEAGSE